MESGEGVMDEAFCVKVMTDEQMEVLRRQIAAYATICEQLVELHRAQYDSLAGMRMGNVYDPMMYGGHKITARQRWTPAPMQLQILEALFGQGNGTPSKQQIKEITSELSQHGKITETNVYNWFQNRRARTKRKQTAAAPDNTSELEAEVESQTERRANSEIKRFQGTQRLCEGKDPEASSEGHSLDPDSYIQTPRMDFQFFQSPEASSEESTP